MSNTNIFFSISSTLKLAVLRLSKLWSSTRQGVVHQTSFNHLFLLLVNMYQLWNDIKETQKTDKLNGHYADLEG